VWFLGVVLLGGKGRLVLAFLYFFSRVGQSSESLILWECL
jgi:hypothetical protein